MVMEHCWKWKAQFIPNQDESESYGPWKRIQLLGFTLKLKVIF